MSKINWEEIHQAYTFGTPKDGKIEFPTLKDLADKYHLSLFTIKKHSSKEKWSEDREQFLKETRQKSQQKVIEKISEDLVPYDVDLFKEAKRRFDQSKVLSIRKPSDVLIIINALKGFKDFEETFLGEKTNKENIGIQIIVRDEETKRMVEKVLNGND
jgi:hypothetical protein